uniref:Phosphoenolpyruvate carboxykinase n=1 Tax=Heterorhabditis bacteriophora TaxID=37862 RepID=A0A1I7WPH1_HETBA
MPTNKNVLVGRKAYKKNLLLFANPCEVFYRGSENSTAVPIWMGEKGVDPDIKCV